MDVTRRARSWSLSEPLGCTAPSCPFCTYSRSPLKEKDEESSIPGQAGSARANSLHSSYAERAAPPRSHIKPCSLRPTRLRVCIPLPTGLLFVPVCPPPPTSLATAVLRVPQRPVQVIPPSRGSLTVPSLFSHCTAVAFPLYLVVLHLYPSP